jgi:hypothetical protein
MAGDGKTAIRRRAVLAAAAGGAAALAAQAAGGLLPGAAQAANGDKVVVGQDNTGVSATWVTTSDASPSLGGVSTTGDGVRGSSRGHLKSGVYGTNDDAGGYGLFGRNLANGNTGALGCPDVGVQGRNGTSGTVGELGALTAGVWASGTDQAPALMVDGSASFRDYGVALVPKGKSSVRVTGVALGKIPQAGLAMLQVYSPGVAVAATVVDRGAGTVTIYLTKKVTAVTVVVYFLFNAPILALV